MKRVGVATDTVKAAQLYRKAAGRANDRELNLGQLFMLAATGQDKAIAPPGMDSQVRRRWKQAGDGSSLAKLRKRLAGSKADLVKAQNGAVKTHAKESVETTIQK